MPFTPYSFMNDGLLDLAYYNRPISTTDVPGIFNRVVMKGGIHAYDEEWVNVRGDKIVIKNMNKDETGQNKVQMFQVDGEGLTFTDQIVIEVAKEALELIIDFN